MTERRSAVQQWLQASNCSGDVRCSLFPLLFAALFVVLTAPAWSAKWEVIPSLSTEETYTDNVSLSPDAQKQSDWITKITPGISIAATGPQLKFNASYTPEIVYYAQAPQDGTTAQSSILQRGTAVGTAELAKQLLFVDAGATVNQYNVSLQGPITAANVNTTGNLATVKSYYASPYIKRDLGSDIQSEARYTYSEVNADDPTNLANSVSDRFNLGLKSGASYKVLAWGLQYFNETINYQTQLNTTSQVITANARRLVSPTVGVLAQAAYESYNSTGSPTSEGQAWATGLVWTPSPVTQMAATFGRRFYGPAYLFDFKHRTALTTWSVAYKQTATNARSELFAPTPGGTAAFLDTLLQSQYPDAEARQKAVEQFISSTALPPNLGGPINFLNNQQFIKKRAEASVGILGIRNVLIASVFRETDDSSPFAGVQNGEGDFAASAKILQTGISGLWNWRISELNTWNLSATFTRNEFPGTEEIDYVRYLAMSFSRRLQPRLFGSLSYRRQQGDSNQNVAQYTENAVFAQLRLQY